MPWVFAWKNRSGKWQPFEEDALESLNDQLAAGYFGTVLQWTHWWKPGRQWKNTLYSLNLATMQQKNPDSHAYRDVCGWWAADDREEFDINVAQARLLQERGQTQGMGANTDNATPSGDNTQQDAPTTTTDGGALPGGDGALPGGDGATPVATGTSDPGVVAFNYMTQFATLNGALRCVNPVGAAEPPPPPGPPPAEASGPTDFGQVRAPDDAKQDPLFDGDPWGAWQKPTKGGANRMEDAGCQAGGSPFFGGSRMMHAHPSPPMTILTDGSRIGGKEVQLSIIFTQVRWGPFEGPPCRQFCQAGGGARGLALALRRFVLQRGEIILNLDV